MFAVVWPAYARTHSKIKIYFDGGDHSHTHRKRKIVKFHFIYFAVGFPLVCVAVSTSSFSKLKKKRKIKTKSMCESARRPFEKYFRFVVPSLGRAISFRFTIKRLHIFHLILNGRRCGRRCPTTLLLLLFCMYKTLLSFESRPKPTADIMP